MAETPTPFPARQAQPALPPPEGLSARVKRLQAEARGLAREHIKGLQAALVEVERLSAEIAGGGEAYPVGVRDIARRLAEDCGAKVQNIATLLGRAV